MAKKSVRKSTTTEPSPRKAASKKTAAVVKSAGKTKKSAKKAPPPATRKPKGGHPASPSISPAVVVWSPGPPTPDRPYLVERILTSDEVHAEYLARKVELDARISHAKEVLERWLPMMKQSRQYQAGEITGLSVCYRRKFGEVVSPLQVVIAVNVADKHREEALRHRQYDPLPRMIEDVPVKVLEGRFKFIGPTLVRPTDPLPFNQVLVGGAPIGPQANSQAFGTLGVILQDTVMGLVGLTNQHVVSGGNVVQLGPNIVPPADPINGLNEARPIGNVTKSLKGEYVRPDGTIVMRTVDCARVDLDNAVAPPPHAVEIRGLNTAGRTIFIANRPIGAQDGSLEVWKFGAASGAVLIGKINNPDVTLVNIGGQDFVHTFSLRHRDGNNSFVIGGDSGSVAAFKTMVNGVKAFVLFGLLFAQLEDNPSVGFGCQIKDVVEPLSLTLDNALFANDWETDPRFV